MKVPTPASGPVMVELRLSDGSFTSSISVPLEASAEDKQRFVEAWMKLMIEGFRLTPRSGRPGDV